MGNQCINIHMISLRGGKLTSIFAHDGCFDVIGCSAPHADGLWITTVHGASLLVETVVSANDTNTKLLKIYSIRNCFLEETALGDSEAGQLWGNTSVHI